MKGVQFGAVGFLNALYRHFAKRDAKGTHVKHQPLCVERGGYQQKGKKQVLFHRSRQISAILT